MRALGPGFFDRSVHEVAPDLVGCTVVHGDTAGVIVETEAYDATDPACHAFGGRTPRNEVIFGLPGLAYVYLSYGIHSLLNAVAEADGRAAAVLVRALEPVAGIALMRRRRPGQPDRELCSGPGKLTQALGIGLELNGASLSEPPLAILARDDGWAGVELVAGPRIGITKATELPWRYSAAGNGFVSRPRPA
ncbi:MAG: DNA-3-methyladenine glycosylase [Solirubrobacterales bacterium]|nr:DNA-3-methyladenine glycosylase [Solirubrobacterales bacterium]